MIDQLEKYNQIKILSKKGLEDSALDMLYDHIDKLLIKEKFETVNNFLWIVNPKEISITLMLGILTITFLFHKKLSHRKYTYDVIEKEIQLRNKNPKKILKGLKGTE